MEGTTLIRDAALKGFMVGQSLIKPLLDGLSDAEIVVNLRSGKTDDRKILTISGTVVVDGERKFVDLAYNKGETELLVEYHEGLLSDQAQQGLNITMEPDASEDSPDVSPTEMPPEAEEVSPEHRPPTE